MDNTHEDSIDSIAYCFWNREESHIYDTFLDAISRAKNNPDSKIYITEDLFIQFRNLMRKQDFLEKYKNETNLRFGINNTVIHYNQDLLPSKIKYSISYDLLRKNINIMPVLDEKITKETNLQNISIGNINKEEKDMLKILEIYGNKQIKKIEQKYDKQLKNIEENDPISVYLKQTEEAIKEMLNSDNVSLVLNSDTMEFTQETVDKKREIIDTIRTEKAKIKAQIEEITALLELAPNYEEKLQILRDYGIIDKKKNIVL